MANKKDQRGYLGNFTQDGMQFIQNGPAIPVDIYQACENDNLVFFCGAGISKNSGLPLFDELVEKICSELSIIDKDSMSLLKEAKKRGDYDGMLDLIEGDQDFSVPRGTLRKKVIEILNKSTGKSDIHKCLLELSALEGNKGHRIVTTNFDRLFFEAGLKKSQFDAAPKLAPPRKETWKNLTFLHGVIDPECDSKCDSECDSKCDPKCDPEGEKLILTKKDIGLAYLHDNWASRFIIQLFQDFTVLFIGYSINDPAMNYLLSAINENQRRRKNNSQIVHSRNFNGNQENEKPSMYAFVGYERGQREEQQNKWKSLGVEPILYQIKNKKDHSLPSSNSSFCTRYKIKNKEDHSLLYDTIEQWKSFKKKGLPEKKRWLKEKLKSPYKESDREIAKTVISFIKTDEELEKYLPEINLSLDPKKKQAVDISWLKAFSEKSINIYQEAEASNTSPNSPPDYQQFKKDMWKKPLNSIYGSLAKDSHLKKLIYKKSNQRNISLWEPLSYFEKSVILWLLHHLDKKELIHWLIEKSPDRNGLIHLHPEFKYLIQLNWKRFIQQNKDIGERQVLFWKLLTMQKNHSDHSVLFYENILISDLNNNYCPIKVQRLLSCLDPKIGFERFFVPRDSLQDEQIYKPRLTINAENYPEILTNKTTLLKHAEDFSNLLKKAMELAELAGMIQNGQDGFFQQRPSIADHEQNTNYPWTYLIDLTRDSFDLAMREDKKTANLLLNKWKLYPYSIFYRLILYAVTKHSDLDENIAIDLFKNNKSILWSSDYQNEVLKYLGTRKHSKEAANQLLSLIRNGHLRSLFKSDITDNIFEELKERSIFKRLTKLKHSRVLFPKELNEYLNKIKEKYKIQETEDDDRDIDDFSVFHTKAKMLGSEKHYYNVTNEQIFDDIKHTKPNTLPDIYEKEAEFCSFFKEFPDGLERAFQILSKFQDNDLSSAPYWGRFISEASMMTNESISKEYFLKSFEKIENFDDDFFKKCLWSLIHGLNLKGRWIYDKDEKSFEKWWNRLWRLSIEQPSNNTDSDCSFKALNSHTGKLSQSIFKVLWSKFSNTIPKNGKIPEDIKNYFHTIIHEGIKKDSSVLYHFGSCLCHLWFLDREWSMANLKSLLNWDKNKSLCKAFWSGYLHHPKYSLKFLSDFKDEFFKLFLNREIFYQERDSLNYCENIADVFFIATGGREIKNIFTCEEIQQLKETIDTEILDPLSRIIKNLLKNSGNKSAVLWSNKIKPWMETFWLPQKRLQTEKIAQNISILMLHCGDKFPEAFKFLKDKIEGGVITHNHDYIGHYIMNHEKELPHIFDHPKKLLQLLNWNFPEDTIYDFERKVKSILDKIKDKHLEVAESANYQKLLKKIQVI